MAGRLYNQRGCKKAYNGHIQNPYRISMDIYPLFHLKKFYMKRMFVMGLLLVSVPAFAQKIDAAKVPVAVKSTFSKNFPKVTSAKWEKENGNFEANFSENGKKMSATFDDKGNWMETESKVEVSELPNGVAAYVAKNYNGQKIKGAAKLNMANGATNYEAEVKGKDIIFDGNGKFIKESKD
jgi:hypothetical protein